MSENSRMDNSSNPSQFGLFPLPDLSLEGNFRKVYRKAIEFSNNWLVDLKGSPAFSLRKVYVNKRFVKYLSGKSMHTTYADAINRLKHVPNSKQIIESAQFIFEKREEPGEVAKYSLIGQIEGGRLLKVIVIEDNQKQQLFVQNVYEVTKSVLHTIGRHLSSEEFTQLPQLLSKPMPLSDLSKSSVKGRVALLGSTGKTQFNLLVFNGKGFTVVRIFNSTLPVIKLGTEIEISSMGLKLKNGIKL